MNFYHSECAVASLYSVESMKFDALPKSFSSVFLAFSVDYARGRFWQNPQNPHSSAGFDIAMPRYCFCGSLQWDDDFHLTTRHLSLTCELIHMLPGQHVRREIAVSTTYGTRGAASRVDSSMDRPEEFYFADDLLPSGSCLYFFCLGFHLPSEVTAGQAYP